MDFTALIVAAGRGLRAGGDAPKQYRALGSVPVLTRTMRAFLAHPGCAAVQVVVHPEDTGSYSDATRGMADPRVCAPVFGGADRQASVRAGLEALVASAPERVLIHDAARPFVSPGVIDRVCAAIRPGRAAFPALPIVDALWRADGADVQAAERREGLWRAQTPQGFRFDDILAAHRNGGSNAADDVAIARAAGLSASVVLGDGNNFKITLPEDFDRAARLLTGPMDIRTGTGFDVHAFIPGNAVTLCGVQIPHDRALSGHSDADVGLHALTDAIFGALAEGDIGDWFPPSDPQWQGAASEIFLEKAVERVDARGFRISHLDCTLICERPKIGPYKEAMRGSVARISRIEPDRVSVKATTSEKLGFTGRGEGIAAMASATLIGR
ncbi:MAG: bifunctional 2-C-methyl-D-erythritol 4-phosphate cytidylyltransferase/2-C-methyl-D-erythritol 2,4-cyclodiphosphate synthase [Pseudomonadota bacterium]